MNNSVISRELLKKEIKWRFNTANASHHGGIWERLIRSVRKILDKMLNKYTTLTDESLITLMCEVENVMNSRPITTVSSDVLDLRPLTPNHLLKLNPKVEVLSDSTRVDVYTRKRWLMIQQLSNNFWTRFKTEYLRSLQERQKWFHKKEDLKINDIVLVMDENTPRCQWPLGRIVAISPSDDGLVRTVEIKTHLSQLSRPINKAILLVQHDS